VRVAVAGPVWWDYCLLPPPVTIPLANDSVSCNNTAANCSACATGNSTCPSPSVVYVYVAVCDNSTASGGKNGSNSSDASHKAFSTAELIAGMTATATVLAFDAVYVVVVDESSELDTFAHADGVRGRNGCGRVAAANARRARSHHATIGIVQCR
jgi:hypothetical protein